MAKPSADKNRCESCSTVIPAAEILCAPCREVEMATELEAIDGPPMEFVSVSLDSRDRLRVTGHLS